MGGGGSQIRVVSITRKNGFPQGGKGRGNDRSTNLCGAATSVDSFGADDIVHAVVAANFGTRGQRPGGNVNESLMFVRISNDFQVEVVIVKSISKYGIGFS